MDGFRQYMDGSRRTDYSKYADSHNVADYDKYMDKYPQGEGGDYQKYMDLKRYQQGGKEAGYEKYVPGSAANCKTEAELNKWWDEQVEQMKYVPEAWKKTPLENERKEYYKYLARIRAREAAKEGAVREATSEDTERGASQPEKQTKEASAQKPEQDEPHAQSVEKMGPSPVELPATPSDADNLAGGYSHYMDGFRQYMDGSRRTDYSKYADSHNVADYDKYMDKYPQGEGGDYQKYMDLKRYQQGGKEAGYEKYVPGSAANCKTEAELNKWWDEQVEQMKYVPEAWKKTPLENERKEYYKYLARIRAREAAKEGAVREATSEDTERGASQPEKQTKEASAQKPEQSGAPTENLDEIHAASVKLSASPREGDGDLILVFLIGLSVVATVSLVLVSGRPRWERLEAPLLPRSDVV